MRLAGLEQRALHALGVVIKVLTTARSPRLECRRSVGSTYSDLTPALVEIYSLRETCRQFGQRRQQGRGAPQVQARL
jgi:hypothetical protein